MEIKLSNYTYAMLILTALSAIYWIAYSINAYNTFHDYNDLATFAMTAYYDIHLTSIVSGLQFITAGNHLSPDFLFMLPFYLVFQSPLTLVIIQALVISATGLLIYYIANDLLKDQRLALLLGAAFLLTPATHGIMIYDFHMEFLIIPVYLLMFYFFIKQDFKKFVITSAFFLGIYEVTIFLALPLVLLFGIYGFIEKEDAQLRKIRLKYAATLAGMFIVFFIFYSIAASSLLNSYNSNQYVNLPRFLYLTPQTNTQAGYILNSSTSNFLSILDSTPYVLLFGLIAALLCFGIAAFYRPIYLLILAAPYLAEVFIAGNSGFLYISGYYFSYVIGGVLIAAILGFRYLQSQKPHMLKWNMYAVIGCTAMLSILGVFFVQSLLTYYFTQSFLFINPPGFSSSYTQLNWIVNQVPPNGSLMAPFFTAPHFANRGQPFEMLTPQYYYFVPKYIVTDFNSNVSLLVGGNASNPRAQYNYVLTFLHNKTLNYTPYEINGTADIFVRNNNT